MMRSHHGVNDPCGRQIAGKRHSIGRPMIPAPPKPDGPPVAVEARCVRLPAKADDPASLAPGGRAAPAVAGRERTADRGQGGGGQSVRRQSRHRPDALRGVSAHARPRLRGVRDRRAGRLDRARGVRLLGRSRDPPRRHPCHASRGGNRSRGGEAAKHLVGGGRRDRRALRHRDGRSSRAPACRSRARPCW